MTNIASLIDSLQEILEDKVLKKAPLGNSDIWLKEASARMKIQITGVAPSPVVVIHMAKASHLSCLKDGNWKQICDYLLIAEINSNCYAVFIELKKTLTEETKPKEQLRRSLPLLNYLLSVCKVEFGNIPKVLPKYAIIAERLNPRLDKQKTRIRPSCPVSTENHESIEIMKFITPRISITKLAAG
ncbi:MAG: hypothetical protein OXC97_06900 [Candidatus Dadabacteria bacterium]|nr:hypothetical protein [Candidatus Dadabacteria bacterium]